MDSHRNRNATFELLYSTYSGQVLARARSIVADPSLAEDAAQLAWERIFKSVPNINMADPLPLVMKLTHWAVQDTLRRRARAQRTVLVDDEALAQHAMGQADEVHDETLRTAQRSAMVASLARLPPAQRNALVMHLIDGLATAEIARRWRTSDDAIRSLVKRARRRFRDEFEMLTDSAPAGVPIFPLFVISARKKWSRPRVIDTVGSRIGEWSRLMPDVSAAFLLSGVLAVAVGRGPVAVPEGSRPEQLTAGGAIGIPAPTAAPQAIGTDGSSPPRPEPAYLQRQTPEVARGAAAPADAVPGVGASGLEWTTTVEAKQPNSATEYDGGVLLPECKGLAGAACRIAKDVLPSTV